MPWTPKDAKRHSHAADTPHLRKLWASVANNALKEYDDEGSAVRAANAAVDRAKAKKSNKQKRGEAETRDEIMPLLDVAGLSGSGINVSWKP